MEAAFLYLQVMAATGIDYESGGRNGRSMSCGPEVSGDHDAQLHARR